MRPGHSADSEGIMQQDGLLAKRAARFADAAARHREQARQYDEALQTGMADGRLLTSDAFPPGLNLHDFAAAVFDLCAIKATQAQRFLDR